MRKELIYIMIGLISGISTGIIGIGAGILTNPLLIYSGMSLHTAVGCSLVMQLLPQSLPGVLLYNSKNYINWIDSIVVVIGSSIGIFIGSWLATNNYISEKIAYKIMTILLIVISIIFTYQHLLT